jgi:hypothetical protein
MVKNKIKKQKKLQLRQNGTCQGVKQFRGLVACYSVSFLPDSVCIGER